MPFWNNPKSDEFRSQFINNRRPIIRTLAQERLKLWELLIKYSQQISSIDVMLQGILSRGISHQFSLSDKKPSISEGSQVFHVSIDSFQTYYSTGPIAYGGQQNLYLCGCRITLHLSVKHILEDDEEIRKAKIAKFTFDRYNEFVEFLKTLATRENDKKDYRAPSLLLAIFSQERVVSLYDRPFQRDQQIYLDVQRVQGSDVASLTKQEIISFKLFIQALQARHANVEFCLDGSYKISW